MVDLTQTRLWTVAEVADHFRWTAAHVYKLIRAGTIAVVRIGPADRASIRIADHEVRRLIVAQRDDLQTLN